MMIRHVATPTDDDGAGLQPAWLRL